MKLSVGREAEMVWEEENKYWQNVSYKNNNKNKLALKNTKGAIKHLNKDYILSRVLGTLFSPRKHFLGDS